ncbi:MAG: BTAD domain-containing putative transcriptional regulator [Aggregatilineales bacterium]
MMGRDLRIKTFGSLLIERDGHIVENFLTLKTALLFAYLAMNRAEHTREKLAFLLWDETTDEQALKNLRTVLSNLRKIVPDAVKISRKWVQIVDPVWIDARVFEDACDAIFAGTPYTLEEMLAIADLYTGEFLRDLSIRQADSLDEWIHHKRDELHQKYLRLLYQIVDDCLETGNIYTGVDVARRLVMLNPLWEAAQRQLMLLLVHLDQSGEAQMQYERVVTLLDTELGTVPDQKTVALYEQIKAGIIKKHQTQTMPRIIMPDLPYIVPEEDILYLRDLLDKPECHLITLLGIGGTGKTMLATYMAHERRAMFRDGVVLVALTAVRDVQTLSQTILSSLNISVKGVASVDQVITALKDRELLLILDNYEQLLPETGLIERILDEVPRVKLLVTSQMPLNLRQEWMIPLKKLKIEQADNQDIAESDALRLFRLTAERVLPHFDWMAYIDDILEICHFLEGLPLGIVIAAGQVKYLSPPEILASLREDMLAMETTYQGMPARHQGFASLINSTIKNLSTEEQHTLMALSIFRGSFTHEAALAVADTPMTTFVSLVDKSLIQRKENFRYTLHSLLRRVFVEKFEASSEKTHIRQRFTAYYQHWCHATYRKRREINDYLLVIDAEHTNIWHINLLDTLEQQRYLLEIMPALHQYWRSHGFGEQVVAVLTPAVTNQTHPASLRARGMVELATMVITMGQQALAQSLSEQAIATAPENLYVRVSGLQTLGRIAMQRGENHSARSFLEQVLELEEKRDQTDDPNIDFLFIGNHTGMGLIAMELGETEIARLHFDIAMRGWKQMNETQLQAQIHNNIGIVDMREGNFDSARQRFMEVLPVIRESQNDILLATLLANLGKTSMMLGNYSDAHQKLTEAIQVSHRLKVKVSTIYQLETFLHLSFLMEQFAITAQLHGFIQKTCRQDNIALSPPTIERIALQVQHMQTTLGDRYAPLVNLGSKLSLDSAVALAQSLSEHLETTRE